jgi:BASS family bile acid:Na+ symporter
MGLVMAALGASLPEMAWFYFAMSQFPIYIFPALLKPLALRFPQVKPPAGA